jgi:glycosyltransferase involved in cell wall biosynthesis
MTRVLELLGPSTGGIRRHVAALTSALVETGWQVETAGPAGVLDGLVQQDHVVPVPSGMRPLRLARAVASARALMRTMPLVHAHGQKPGWVAAVARTGLSPRPRLVVTVHNLVLEDVAGGASRLLVWVERRLGGRADAIIATSPEVAGRMAATASLLRIVRPVGPPATPRRSAADVRQRLGAGDRPLVVCVARLHPQKGLDVLVEAAAELAGRQPPPLVAIVGEGPLERDLREQIARRDLADVVRLTGPSDHAADELAAAEVVVVPSRWESGPLVVAEALQLGRPVVATPVGFVAEVIEEGRSGRIVPIGDPTELAAAVAELLDDPARAAAMGAAGRQRADALLGPAHLVAGVVDVYRAVLGCG